MIHVLAAIECAPGARDRFLADFARLAPLVRAEEGCIEYVAAVDARTGLAAQAPPRDDLVTVIEKWSSAPALAAHLEAPHMHEHRTRMRDVVTRVTIHVLDPAG